VTVTALVSGGKDSIYAAYLAETQGWTVDELVTLRPRDPDSMMFHTPNLPVVPLQAEAWAKPHRFVDVPGTGSVAEEEALERALQGPGTVVAGAVGSSFQWGRLHRVAYRVGRKVYTPLWGKAPERVVQEEILAGLSIRFVHLAAESLDPALLGQPLDEGAFRQLLTLSQERARVHVAGEGGEYETVVLDAPFFIRRIVVDAVEHHRTRDVSRLNILRAHLEPKGS
jgi:predicted ATP pyrophosphatase (TIGR00289 family)